MRFIYFIVNHICCVNKFHNNFTVFKNCSSWQTSNKLLIETLFTSWGLNSHCAHVFILFNTSLDYYIIHGCIMSKPWMDCKYNRCYLFYSLAESYVLFLLCWFLITELITSIWIFIRAGIFNSFYGQIISNRIIWWFLYVSDVSICTFMTQLWLSTIWLLHAYKT